jgi:hypothetical protein
MSPFDSKRSGLHREEEVSSVFTLHSVGRQTFPFIVCLSQTWPTRWGQPSMWRQQQHQQQAAPSRPPDDDEPTGPSAVDDDLWTVAEHRSESAFSDFADDLQSEFTDVPPEAADWDVRSVASMRSWISTAPAEHAVDGGGSTASTTGLPVPLAFVPVFLLRGAGSRGSSDDDDARSFASINTRHGWPRVSPNATMPAERTRPASYRDILLAEPRQTQPLAEPARRRASNPKQEAAAHAEAVRLVPPVRLLQPNAPTPPRLVPVVHGLGGRLELCGRSLRRRRGLNSAESSHFGRGPLESLPEGAYDDELYEMDTGWYHGSSHDP